MHIKTFVSMLVIILLLAGSVLAGVGLFDVEEGTMTGSVGDGDWPMLGKDLQRTSFTESQGPLTDNILWCHKTEFSAFGMNGGVVVDGRLYYGTGGGDVYCLDAVTGEEIWKHTIGVRVVDTPCYYDGCLYVVTDNVYCLDADDGSELWMRDIVYPGHLIVSDGRVFCLADYELFCLDVSDGSILWSVQDEVIFKGFSIDGTRLVVGTDEFGQVDLPLYCFDTRTGEILWTCIIPDGMMNAPVIEDGRVYAGSFMDRFYCLDLYSGEFIWEYDPGASMWSAWAVAHGNVYFSCMDGRVICLRASDGVGLWDWYGGGLVDIPSPLIVAGDNIYLSGSIAPFFFCLDAFSGELVWSRYFSGTIMHSACVVDNRLYFGCNNGGFYCLGDPVDVSIESIDAGIGSVSMTVSNLGDTTIEDIVCTIDVAGNILELLHGNTINLLYGTTYVERVVTLEPGESEVVSCYPLFGLSEIRVTATACNAEYEGDYEEGFGNIFLLFTSID